MLYKVYLSKEQWAKVCETSDEIAVDLARQQPELAAELGIGLQPQPPIVTRKKADKPAEKPSDKPPAK